MTTDEKLQERDAKLLDELESSRLRLLESRDGLDPWSDEWDRAKAKYQDIERRIAVISLLGTARYHR